MNQWRSPTAERIYARDQRISVRSRGTSQKARRTVTEEDLVWADVVFVMEDRHRHKIEQQHPSQKERLDIHVLDIPDDYRFMDPELIACIRESVEAFLTDQSANQ